MDHIYLLLSNYSDDIFFNQIVLLLWCYSVYIRVVVTIYGKILKIL